MRDMGAIARAWEGKMSSYKYNDKYAKIMGSSKAGCRIPKYRLHVVGAVIGYS